jgi:hypothetical protein
VRCRLPQLRRRLQRQHKHLSQRPHLCPRSHRKRSRRRNRRQCRVLRQRPSKPPHSTRAPLHKRCLKHSRRRGLCPRPTQRPRAVNQNQSCLHGRRGRLPPMTRQLCRQQPIPTSVPCSA